MYILCYIYPAQNRAENYPKLQYNFPRQCFSYAFSSAKALIINGVKTFFGSHCIFSFAISQDIFSIFKLKCKKIATEIAQNYAHHVLLRIPNPCQNSNFHEFFTNQNVSCCCLFHQRNLIQNFTPF